MKTELKVEGFQVGDILLVDAEDLNDTGHPMFNSKPGDNFVEKGSIVRLDMFVRSSFEGQVCGYDSTREKVYYLTQYPHHYKKLTKEQAYMHAYGGSITSVKTIKPMKAVKQVTTKIKGVERDLTVVAIINNGQVRVGYAVRNPEDEKNDELSEKIATGRALADRTNLADMTVGIGMDKKYILYAIVEHFVRQIERGSIEVKGIK